MQKAHCISGLKLFMNLSFTVNPFHNLRNIQIQINVVNVMNFIFKQQPVRSYLVPANITTLACFSPLGQDL